MKKEERKNKVDILFNVIFYATIIWGLFCLINLNILIFSINVILIYLGFSVLMSFTIALIEEIKGIKDIKVDGFLNSFIANMFIFLIPLILIKEAFMFEIKRKFNF